MHQGGALGRLDVALDGFLAAVEPAKEGREARSGGGVAARKVALARAFDLDHARARIRQPAVQYGGTRPAQRRRPACRPAAWRTMGPRAPGGETKLILERTLPLFFVAKGRQNAGTTSGRSAARWPCCAPARARAAARRVAPAAASAVYRTARLGLEREALMRTPLPWVDVGGRDVAHAGCAAPRRRFASRARCSARASWSCGCMARAMPRRRTWRRTCTFVAHARFEEVTTGPCECTWPR